MMRKLTMCIKTRRHLAAVALLLLVVRASAVPARAGNAQSGNLPQNVARLYDSAQYEQAAEALQAAIDANPQNAWLSYWLGRCFYETHDFGRAVSSFERAIALDPNRSDFHDWLGKASGRKAEEQGRFAAFSAFSLARKTRREFETAVRLDPKNIEAQRDFIRYLSIAPGIVGGNEERAQAQIAELAHVDQIEADLARAEFYAARKKFDSAAAEYQKILDAGPGRIDVCFEIADYFRDRSDGVLMQQAVEVAAKLAPSDRRLAYYRGVASVLTNDMPHAEQNLREYIEKVPPNAEVPPHSSAHEWLGRLYENNNDFAKAAAEYEAALDLDPRNKSLRDALKRTQTNKK